MTVVRQPVLSPIRFYDPSKEFDNATDFQNPDNRVSTGYDWENVTPYPYHLPIPKRWPDGQPGIDFMLNTAGTTSADTFYADLYDEDDVLYKSLYVHGWDPIDSGHQYHVWLDGVSGSGIAEGFYTIKIFATDDDELLLESEALYITDWFEDMIPFEFWNFENDFGIVWEELRRIFTARIMAPVRIYDPEPTFEKEVYQNDPGILTTLRVIPQRAFNFDSLSVNVHIAELFQLGFACSELYLDRIKINSEESPESVPAEGTNIKTLTGKATFVDFNVDYVRELVDTSEEDQSIDWATTDYVTGNITANSIVVNDPVIGSSSLGCVSQSISFDQNDIIIIKVTLTDDGSSDLPQYSFASEVLEVKEWGVNYFVFRLTDEAASYSFELLHNQNQRAVFTGLIEVFKVV